MQGTNCIGYWINKISPPRVHNGFLIDCCLTRNKQNYNLFPSLKQLSNWSLGAYKFTEILTSNASIEQYLFSHWLSYQKVEQGQTLLSTQHKQSTWHQNSSNYKLVTNIILDLRIKNSNLQCKLSLLLWGYWTSHSYQSLSNFHSENPRSRKLALGPLQLQENEKTEENCENLKKRLDFWRV